MPTPPQTPPPALPWTLIQNDTGLAHWCHHAKASPTLAVDTEFVGEKYFYAKVELVQIASTESVALVDAQGIKDWGPLRALLSGPALKIFHAASQDLVILRRLVGSVPSPVFDTQVAASLLGYGAQISLSALLRMLAGVEASSKQTTSDWSARPLTHDQLEYAATDVRYLAVLHAALRADLEQRGRTAWYEEEQQLRLDEADEEDEVTPDQLMRRVKDWLSLAPRELAVLRELAVWRDATAKKKNLPRRTVFTDEGLVELAKFQPKTKEEMLKLRRIHGGQVARFGDELKEVMERGRRVPKEQWPEKTSGPRVDIPTGVIEVCQALIRSEAERQHLAPTLLATTADLTRLLVERGSPDAQGIPLLHGWRREVAGQQVLDLLDGKIAIRVGPEGLDFYRP